MVWKACECGHEISPGSTHRVSKVNQILRTVVFQRLCASQWFHILFTTKTFRDTPCDLTSRGWRQLKFWKVITKIGQSIMKASSLEDKLSNMSLGTSLGEAAVGIAKWWVVKPYPKIRPSFWGWINVGATKSWPGSSKQQCQPWKKNWLSFLGGSPQILINCIQNRYPAYW